MKQTLSTTAAWHRKPLAFLLVTLLCLGTFSCSPDYEWDDLDGFLDDINKAEAIPANIVFHEPGLYPEGVGHDALHQRFLVSSAAEGTIGAVSYAGNYTPFITDDRLIGTAGIQVDEERKRVLVAGADPGAAATSTPETAGKLAQLGIFDLETGKAIHVVELSALRPGMPHFANDVAVDALGNAYVTDSYSPIIYKVDLGGNATVFYENEAFATAPGAFGFNGIEYHPDGFLLVAFSSANEVYKIPVDNTAGITKVELDAALVAPDGLLLSKDGKQLVVVNNAGGQPAGKVVSFKSTDNWASGSEDESFSTGAVFPTTATGYGDAVFVLYAHLNVLFGDAASPQAEYTIKKIPFKNNQALKN